MRLLKLTNFDSVLKSVKFVEGLLHVVPSSCNSEIEKPYPQGVYVIGRDSMHKTSTQTKKLTNATQ